MTILGIARLGWRSGLLTGVIGGWLILGGGCNTADREASSLAEETVELFSRGAFFEVAALMHYPPSLSADEVAAERGTVAKALEIIEEELGAPARVGRRASDPSQHYVEISAGDLPYWGSFQSSGDWKTLGFAVRFERAGAGFLDVVVMDDGTSTVQSIRCGLARGEPSARLDEVMRRLVEELTPVNPADVGLDPLPGGPAPAQRLVPAPILR